MGSNFDVCTNEEIKLVKNCGIEPSWVIHTHPIKKYEEIEYALDYGIETFVFDSEFELRKF